MTATAPHPHPTDLDRLVVEHSGHLRALLRGLGLRGADLDDALQDTFARAVVRLDQLRDRDQAGAWLRTIARRIGADHHRRTQREARAVQAPDGDTHERAAAERQARRTLHTPDHALDVRERREAVRAAVAKLPPSQREAIQAFYFEERSYADIERARGLSRSALAVRLHKGRKRLAELLGGALPSAPVAASTTLPALPFWIALGAVLFPLMLAIAPVLMGRLMTSPKRRSARAGVWIAALVCTIMGGVWVAAPSYASTPAAWLCVLAFNLAGAVGAVALTHGLSGPVLRTRQRLRPSALIAAIALIVFAALNTAHLFMQIVGSVVNAFGQVLSYAVVAFGALMGQACWALWRGPRLRGLAVIAAPAALLVLWSVYANAHQPGLEKWWLTVAGTIALFEVACAGLIERRAGSV